MPDFVALDEGQRRAAARHAAARDLALRIELMATRARAEARVALAVAAGLDPGRPAQARRLAALHGIAGRAYGRLARSGSALRFARGLAAAALRRVGQAVTP